MIFCNPFDEVLFREGPPAVFLQDRKGQWRFDETWTRDAWGREPGPHERGETWLLLRDRGTGFVHLVLATSPTLLGDHPRCDVRRFDTLDAARAARSAFGEPPLTSEAW